MAQTRDQLQDRFEGCLLAGAIGDALGYGIEFWDERRIFATYGDEGIENLFQAAELAHRNTAPFSDDTQMTLFTANGLTLGLASPAQPMADSIFLAYCEWLGTQGDTSRMPDPTHPKTWLYKRQTLHALRAPGNTCLSAIRSTNGGRPERPVNNSCGCGGVMRVAPVGLLAAVREDIDVLRLGAEAAALTHGHPQGWLPAALLAEIVRLACLAETDSVETDAHTVLFNIVLKATIALIDRFPNVPETKELVDLVMGAAQLSEAHEPSHAAELQHIHQLGEGWVGHEALAIAFYAALSYPDDMRAALRCAVNHKGDSDSTGAICGNILGALWGASVVRHTFHMQALEDPALIIRAADELLATAQQTDPTAKTATAEPDAHTNSVPHFVNPPQVEGHMPTYSLPEDAGMPYTPLTKRALDLSFAMHQAQRDKAGRPYVYHPFHLADQMRSEETACVALLHDTVEDGGISLDDLRRHGFTESIVHAVDALTHRKGTPYMEYVLALRAEPIAREVKLADLRHNANLSRLDSVTGKDRQRHVKYLIAQALLDDTSDSYDALAAPPRWRKRVPLDDQRLCFLSIFYDASGTWMDLSFDVEASYDEHYLFDATYAEPLRHVVDPSVSLFEGLAGLVEMGGPAEVVQALEKVHVPYQALRY